MTDGTSQGLFIVVAIVIFGVFVALSYTVFGTGGLSSGISGLFENATEQAETSLLHAQGGFTYVVDEVALETVRLRGYSGSYSEFIYMSSDVQYAGEDSIEVHLNSESRPSGGSNDVSFRFRDSRYANIPEGTPITVSYMVKGDDLVLGSRLGTTGPKYAEDRTTHQVTSDWSRFEHTFNKMNDSKLVEYIFYSETAGKINISDFKVITTLD